MSVQDIYEAACFQDIGGRKEQQDRVEILWSDAACLVVLADGLGGHIDGAWAAQTAVDVANETFHADPSADAADLFQAIIADAHERINTGEKHGNYPGTTCVLLHLTPHKATWTHVGDSRFYHFRDSHRVARTEDHSSYFGMMYACLGGGLEELPDLAIGTVETSASDSFLLCSDGLSGNVDEEDMGGVFNARDLPGALRELVSQARSLGGESCDNISVAAVRLAR